MTDALLDVRHLTVVHREGPRSVLAVRDVSLQLRRGEALALVGESGSGKSTLALALAGLLPGTSRLESGEVVFEGLDLARCSERVLRTVRGRRIGFVFQQPRATLNPVLSAREHLVQALRSHQTLSRQDANTQALALLAEVGIPDPAALATRYPFELSGGQGQRLAIALAICHRPQLLIADEPTSALDATLAVQTLDLLSELGRRHGTTVLLVSHDLAAVRGYCDRVAVMYHGRVVELGPVEACLGAPRHPYTRALVDCAVDLAAAPPGSTLRAIPGTPPGLDLEIPGCSFAPRCPVATTACTVEPPPRVSVSPEHWAACPRTPPERSA